jgi:protein-glutamine gamma-glutamyltransferase
MSATVFKDQRPLAVTERDAALRRFDLAARSALLAAGLAAQAAMWAAAHSRVYPFGALLLIAVSVESARRPLTTFKPRSKRRFSERQLTACRVVAGVLLVEVCLGVVGLLHVADAHSIAAPLGVLLVTVQAAHAMAVESRRDLKLACAVVVALLVQAGAFTTTAAVRLPMLASLGCLLIAGALIQRASALALVDAIVLPGRTPLTRSWLGPVLTAGVVALVAFLAIPNSFDLGITAHVAQRSSDAGAPSRTDASNAASSTRAQTDAGASRLDLSVRGALPTAAVFVVSAAAPAYWQGSILDSYNGSSWTSTGAAAATPWSTDADATQTAPAAASSAGSHLTSDVQRTDTVQVVSATPLDVVLAPGRALSYRGPGTVVADGAGVPRLVAPHAGPANGAEYEVTSEQSGATSAQLRASRGPDPTGPDWLALPAELPTRVRTLAATLAGNAASRYDAVDAIETYLQTHETYDLASPEPAAGHDAVDDFLFISQRGFCEQFASAAVVMLRSLGIPSRLVVGFANGDTTTHPGERVMRGTDAHAWIQVWYPGYGWVASDPTAGSVLAAPTAVRPTAVTPSAAAPTPPQVSAPVLAQAPVPALARHARDVPGGRLLWFELIGAGALGFVVAARVVGRAIRRRRHRAAGVARSTDGPVLQAYLRLDASLPASSKRRAPNETVGEAATRLALTPAQLAVSLRSLERECYGIDPPAHADVVAAVDVLDRLRRGPDRGSKWRKARV